MSFAAVVVSYNRLPLLRKCLIALENQSQALDEIIVVDNGSTDGSVEYIRSTHPRVTLFQTSTNLGGAGGFAWGIELALARGHEAAWIMDDDAEPELDAVAPLVAGFQDMEPKPAFIASLVTAGRGIFNKRNPPVVSTNPQYQVMAAEYGGFAIQTATFVGVMINLEQAKKTHLPIADYFIWMDDSEYTHRLSDESFAVLLPQSMVNHPDDKPISNDMGARLFYFIRNRLWYTRSRTSAISTDGLEVVGILLHAAKQFPAAASKKMWLSCVLRGFWYGVFARPRKVMPGELIATLPENERTRLGI